MAIPGSSSSVRLPHNVVIALAVSLMNSKPRELTFRGLPTSHLCVHECALLMQTEYFRLLHEHVAKGRLEDALSSRHFHLDRTSLWRQAYEQERQGRLANQDEIRELKLKNGELKTMLEKSRPSIPAKKRKKVDEDVVAVPRSSKRAKPDPSPAKLPTASGDRTTDFDFTDIGEVGKLFHSNYRDKHELTIYRQHSHEKLLPGQCDS